MNKNNYILFGVSGSGKTTIGKNISINKKLKFFDADKFHSYRCKIKMKSGIRISDAERKIWLKRIILKLKKTSDNWVLACSALKEIHRKTFRKNFKNVLFVWLDCSQDEVLKRVNNRKRHFFPSKLVPSQFETLQIPNNCIRLDTEGSLVKVKIKARGIVNKCKKINYKTLNNGVIVSL